MDSRKVTPNFIVIYVNLRMCLGSYAKTLLDYSNSRSFLEYNCVKNCSALFLHKSRKNKKQLGLLLITTELDSHHNIFCLSHLDLTAVVLFA